ncbi:MAG TPA: hypothetical protein VMJ34_09640 [Bryobacteraceae bacterium]|nr:hypothetical protein [Bryobacteraceae bacterium]
MFSPARLTLASVLFTGLTLPSLAATTTQLSDDQINDIITKFAAKESEFQKARSNYTYRQSVKVQTLDEAGQPDGGKYQMVSDIIFSPEGKRVERVVYAPVNTLERLILTPEDMQDLRDVQPFVLTTDQIPDYYIRYLGHEQVDEVPCYAFAVKPKHLEPTKRYFEGQIWVDDKDLQIVKTYGRGVGNSKGSKGQMFPKFETYREQIDGKYWFPTYTYANDTLNFPEGPLRMKMVMKYEDYKQFKSDVNIKFNDIDNPGTGEKAEPEKLAPPLDPKDKDKK